MAWVTKWGAMNDPAASSGVLCWPLELPLADDRLVHMRLTDMLGEDVHEGLVDVLDYAVVVCGDVQIHVRDIRRSTAGEAGHGDDRNPGLFGPQGGAHDVFGVPRGADGDQCVAGLGQGAKLIGEDLVVRDIVGDSRDYLDRGAQRDYPWGEIRVGLHQFAVIADEMIGDRRRSPIAARIDRAARAVDLRQNSCGLRELAPIDRRGGRRDLSEIGAGKASDVGEFLVGKGHDRSLKANWDAGVTPREPIARLACRSGWERVPAQNRSTARLPQPPERLSGIRGAEFQASCRLIARNCGRGARSAQ